MILPQDPRERRASIIAACVTFGAALVILVLLFILSVGDNRAALAQESIPELHDDEEIFLEPELLQMGNDGEEELDLQEEAAPQPPGIPDQGETEQKVSVVQNTTPDNNNTSNQREVISTPKPSDVPAPKPKPSDEDNQRITNMGGNFNSPNNGAVNGQSSPNSGSGGNGVTASGVLKGRQMLSCNRNPIALKPGVTKGVVKVEVVVNAKGDVTSAKAISGPSELFAECERRAKNSKWSASKGAPDAKGTITFTIKV